MPWRRKGPKVDKSGRSSGYTLVEVATVMLVIGALLAIAVATYLNAQAGSQEKVAKSRARAALMASRSYVSSMGSLPAAPADLKQVEPSLDYTDEEGARVLGKVYVRNDTGELYLGTAARDGKTCYWVKDSQVDGTWYAETACDATAAAIEAAFERSW